MCRVRSSIPSIGTVKFSWSILAEMPTGTRPPASNLRTSRRHNRKGISTTRRSNFPEEGRPRGRRDWNERHCFVGSRHASEAVMPAAGVAVIASTPPPLPLVAPRWRGASWCPPFAAGAPRAGGSGFAGARALRVPPVRRASRSLRPAPPALWGLLALVSGLRFACGSAGPACWPPHSVGGPGPAAGPRPGSARARRAALASPFAGRSGCCLLAAGAARSVGVLRGSGSWCLSAGGSAPAWAYRAAVVTVARGTGRSPLGGRGRLAPGHGAGGNQNAGATSDQRARASKTRRRRGGE